MWMSAAKDGMIYGLVLVVCLIICWTLRLDIEHPSTTGLINFLSIGACVYYFANRRASQFTKTGFGFAQSMGYILAMALFAGFIYGAGSFLMWNYVAVDYYQEIMNLSIANIDPEQFGEQLTEGAVELTRSLTKKPSIMIFAGIFNILTYSCFVGILVSVFVKKLPQQPLDTTDDEQ